MQDLRKYVTPLLTRPSVLHTYSSGGCMPKNITDFWDKISFYSLPVSDFYRDDSCRIIVTKVAADSQRLQKDVAAAFYSYCFMVCLHAK